MPNVVLHMVYSAPHPAGPRAVNDDDRHPDYKDLRPLGVVAYIYV
jgi:hypothetical protein